MTRLFRVRTAFVLGFLATLTLLAGLTGCSTEQDELQTWMDEQRREVRPRAEPLIPPKRYDPQPYLGAQSVEPFSSQKLAVALKQEERQPNSLLANELNRRKEPLESYPLDSMSMVGSVSRGNLPTALLKVNSLLYQVKTGDYLGQNFGKILSVSETEVTLREVVQDVAGEWIERPATLQLQEKAK